jgi:nucleoside-diphosphate-sugar epimerase
VYIEAFGARFTRISGTVRTTSSGTLPPKVHPVPFDGQAEQLAEAMAASTCLLISAPPAALAVAAVEAFKGAGRTQPLSVVYLSSLSVYGDHGCAWIDESAELKAQGRGRDRIAAEDAWTEFGRATGSTVAILRLAGIYGPGRNALVNIAAGRTQRINKPGQVFNRIHAADIAQVIDACFQHKASGAFNVSDDAPGPPQDVIAYAGELLGRTLPPEISFDEAKATMSPMAQSFYAECKRADNSKIKSELGVTLHYPSYREALDALFAARDHERQG